MKNTLLKFESAELGVSFGGMLYQGKPVVDAVELAKSLGYANPHEALQDNCKSLIKLNSSQTLDMGMGFRPKGVILAPESDAYRLILRSRLPKAEKVQDWICEEVLPVIRETGRYESVPAGSAYEVSNNNDLLSMAKIVAEATVAAAIRAMEEVVTNRQQQRAERQHKASDVTEDFTVFDCSKPEPKVTNLVCDDVANLLTVRALATRTGLADSACRRLIEFAHVPARKIGRSGLHADSDAFVAAACKLIGESEPPKGKIKRWQHPEFGGFMLRRAVSVSGQEKKD
ncbi:DNA-binding protein [Salmonella enterica]|nr:DNA-binding protein [Salmonella enterica]EKB5506511.1 DNA-binding protein [Salmonella enterica]EKC2470746.1 DNA-binding protein [Salmonella enterica]EKC2485112.1 DNA-binding protein [Salmonella enterica]EKC2513843.1 DNA-binding protein [Salmonella enterica]